ncbi:MAG: CocE/NonD family hydrolase [Acidobacteria bacterium]|nr:CocE/NonD family hydrolase [Acidobacteriota bacterium]
MLFSRSDVRTVVRGFRFVRNAIWPNVQVAAVCPDIHVDWDVRVMVRDGTVLRVNVFRPKGSGSFPVLLSAHPYGKDKIPAKSRSGRGAPLQSRLLPQPHPVCISAYTSWEAPDPAVWVREGYAVVNADLRGGGTSEGVGDLFSDEEAQDYYDLIEWAGTRPWSTGRVGLDGVSYLAISQYKVAALQPPHLTAICPWEGLSDLYRDFARPGGVLENGFSKLWSRLTGKEAHVQNPLYEAIVKHTERDDWYQARTPKLEDIQVPLLVCGSFSDHLLHTRGSFEVFRRAGSRQKWLYTHRDGKWCAYYSEDATQTRIRFFDHFLKGLDNGWDQEPPVRLAITEAGPDPAAVIHVDAWPPRDVEWKNLSLDASTSTMELDQTFAPANATVSLPKGRLSFLWIVPEDMDVIGHMALYLHLEVQGATDVSLFAGLSKLRNSAEVTFEGSYGFSGDMVSKGWQRAAHRDLDAELSTAEQPVYTHRRIDPLEPGEVVPVAIAMRPHATRLRKGDHLRLDIQGRWFYPKSKFRGQFPAAYEESAKAICTFHTGGEQSTYLLIATRSPFANSGRQS